MTLSVVYESCPELGKTTSYLESLRLVFPNSPLISKQNNSKTSPFSTAMRTGAFSNLETSTELTPPDQKFPPQKKTHVKRPWDQ